MEKDATEQQQQTNLEKIKENPVLFQNVLNKILKVGESSANVLLEILEDKTTPNEVKLSIAGGLLRQVMDFLTMNNGQKNGGDNNK